MNLGIVWEMSAHRWRIGVAVITVVVGVVAFLPAGEDADPQATRKQATKQATQFAKRGSMENPYVLTSAGELIITLDDPYDVKVVKLSDSKSGVSPEWRVIDLGLKVQVRVFDLNAGDWSDSFEFTSASKDRYIPDKKYRLIEFRAPTLNSGEIVRIAVIGAPYGAT